MYTAMERLLQKEFQSSLPEGSVVGSMCKNPELMEEAWEKDPIVSRSNKVTLEVFLCLLSYCTLTREGPSIINVVPFLRILDPLPPPVDSNQLLHLSLYYYVDFYVF